MSLPDIGLTVRHTPGGVGGRKYPITLSLEMVGGPGAPQPQAHRILSVEEAEELVDSLRDVIYDAVEADRPRFVRVTVLSDDLSPAQRGRMWTYRDRSCTLQEGDLVEVPFGYADTLLPARVEYVDKQPTYFGLIKDVYGRLLPVPLAGQGEEA